MAARALYTSEQNMVFDDPKIKLGAYVQSENTPAQVLDTTNAMVLYVMDDNEKTEGIGW